MIKDYERTKTYIPAVDGNLTAESDDQVVVTYPAVSRETRTKILPRMAYKALADEDGNPAGFEGELKISERTLIAGMKPRFKNYGYRDNDLKEIKMIKNADDLFAAPDEIVRDMIEDLVAHFRAELQTDTSEKN